MTSFSIQLTVAPLCNCISYLLPFQNPDQNLSVICKIQSVTHILSFLITVNMLFIYYLLNLLMFIKPSLAISKLISGLIYSINWIILITLGIFNYLQRPIKGKLNVCRYDTGAIIPTINTFYSGFIMFATIVVFVVIRVFEFNNYAIIFFIKLNYSIFVTCCMKCHIGNNISNYTRYKYFN